MAFECHPIKLYICYFVIRTTKCSTTSDLQIFLPNSLLLSLDVLLCVNDRNFGFQDSPLVQMFVFLCVHAHPCVFLLGQHILIVEPLSLGSRQDPFHGAGSGICLYLICQGQSQSKAKPGKVSRSPDSAFATGLLLHLFSFWLPVEYVLYNVFVKNCNWVMTRVRKRAKIGQRFLWVVTQPGALTLHSWVLQPAWEGWAAHIGAIGRVWEVHVMLFAPWSVPVLICGSSVHRHEEALNLALCFTYLHFCSVEALVTLIKSELYSGG